MFSAPVTAIKILQHPRICLAGTGPYVLAFDLTTNEQLIQEKILIDSIVHGFEIQELKTDDVNSSYIIVVFGQRSFAVINWSRTEPTTFKTILPQTSCISWILSSLIIHAEPNAPSLNLLFGTALNQIYRYANKQMNLIQSFKYTTLYSSCLFHHSNEHVFFAGGTVFGELILYEEEEKSNDIFQEKFSVSDHHGAIFNITYHRNLICTVGDDRTVKFYRFHNSLELIGSFFAHDARIWQSSLTSTHILSCGEDSSIRLWSQKSTKQPLRCFSVHRCKSAWAMDILRDEHDDQPLMIVSGWSDGAVRRHYLDDVPLDSHDTIVLKASIDNDYPRNVVFINETSMLVHMHSGQLLRVNDIQNERNVSIFYDGQTVLKNAYAKMAVAKDGEKLIAVGSLDGTILIFDQQGFKRTQFQIDFNRNNKILQLIWLNKTSSSKLLVCLPEGIMFVYQITIESVTVLHRLDFLPDFEQRWPNTCFYLEQHRILLVGDRQGNLLSYDLTTDDSSVSCPIHQQFARLHGINGTSSIDLDESTQSIHSCGRDGYINIFNFDVDQRQLIHQTTLTITSEITWLDRLFPQLSLISCFTTNHFCLYLSDEQSKRRLMQVECGGGHRNNDLCIEKNLQVNFSYVRNKQVFLARKNIMRIVNEETCLSRTPPSHGTEIRCIKLFHFNQRLHLTTGSEDTQIKLFAFENNGERCRHISTLQSHLSAVCDMTMIDQVMFSCGARAQLFAWQIKENLIMRSGHFMLHPLRRRHGGGGGGNMTEDQKSEKIDEDHGLDVRFTSVAAMSTDDCGVYLVFVTGSDALLRVFRYTNSTNRFVLLQTCSHSEYCQLKVKVFAAYQLVFVSSTDGLLSVYDFSSLNNSIRSSTCRIHQSGINDFDVTSLSTIDSRLRLASVGDDGSIHVSIFDRQNWTWTREYSKEFSHQSPATGIRFVSSTMFISIGIDQRLKFWLIDQDRNDLELRKTTLVDIRDILSMDMISSNSNENFVIAIAGADVHLNSLRMRCFFEFIPWKKVIVRGCHLLLVFGVIASLVFQPSDLRTALYDEPNYFYCLVYGILVYLSLFFYFMTCYMDPGYVPYRRIPNWTGQMNGSSDEEDESPEGQRMTTNSNSHLRKCLLCNIEQPLRSHHCDFCNRCVLKYDHHCPYLETCIGEKNHRYFWCFLLTTDILNVWSTMICSRSFVPFADWSSWLHVNKFRLFAMHVLIISLGATTILFCIHSFFALTNSTTWERVSRHRITYLNRLPDDDLNPFHQGYCHNFFCSFLCHRVKAQQWDVIYKKRMEEHVTLNM